MNHRYKDVSFLLYAAILIIIFASIDESLAAKGSITHGTLQTLNKTQRGESFDSNLNFELSADRKMGQFYSNFDGSLRYYHSRIDYTYSVSTAYLENQNKDFSLGFGKKLLEWNPEEKFWGLNDLNVQRSFDLLDEKQEGLIGLYYDYDFGLFDLSVFLSYFYIPQKNPELRVDNGQIKTKALWVKRPPSRTMLQGREVPVHYSIEVPKERDVFFHKSLGMRMGKSWKQGAFSLFTIYKPENRLRINAEAFYDFSLDRVLVQARPIVNHHVLYGFNLEQKMFDIDFNAGFKIIDPNPQWGKNIDIVDPMDLTKDSGRKPFHSDYFKIEPSYKRQSYVHFASILNRSTYRFSLNYIHLMTDNTKGSDDFYSDAFKWKKALGFSFAYNLTDNFCALLKVKYDLLLKDSVVQNELSYKFFEKMRLAIGIEFLEAPSKESYWSSYRTNDILYSGLSYIF